MKLRNHFTIIAVYLLVPLAAFSLAAIRLLAQNEITEPTEKQTIQSARATEASPKSLGTRFTLSTNRTYGTDEKARVWVSYENIDALDFRVYQVKEPLEFFLQLENLRQMGEADASEVEEIAEIAARKPSFLEQIRGFKSSVYRTVKRYVRNQLRRRARTTFNDKYRSGDRLPLDVADYANFPLLNSGKLTLRGRWRQTLAPLDGELDGKYESRMVSLGRREPGVYLIEAVYGRREGDLRAYTISVVTDLTMIYKTAANGEFLIYIADRQSGEPRDGVWVEIGKGQGIIAKGNTNSDGILRVHPPRESLAVWSDQFTNSGQKGMFIMAQQGHQFVISDLGYHFNDEQEEGNSPSGNLKSYIYTDRPVYRPGQKVYFKGIIRRYGLSGYEMPAEDPVAVEIEGPDGRLLFTQQFKLSPYGTFYGEADLGADTGYCTLTAQVGKSKATANFEIVEYEKPNFKLRVAPLKRHLLIGERTTFNVEAKYFSGAPLARANVSYLIYRAPYRHVWSENQYDAELIGARQYNEDEEEEDNIIDSANEGEEGNYGYGDDPVTEGNAQLDILGRLEIPFDVPLANSGEPGDFKYRLEVTVTDAADNSLGAVVSVIVTRASTVVQATAEKKIVYAGDQAKIRVNTADYNGRPVSRRVILKFIERKWERREIASASKPVVCSDHHDYLSERVEVTNDRPGFKQIEAELGTGEVTTNAQGESWYSWRVPAAGIIEIVAILREGGREIRLPGGELWATDRTGQQADFAAANIGSIKLVPDKPLYQLGETARVRIVLPTNGAHLLVTTERHSVIKAWRVHAPGHQVDIEVLMDQDHAPNVYLSVCYVKNGEVYTADKVLAAPARDKFLKLEILPDKQMYKPGEPASYVLVVRNEDGSPAAGVEVSLGIIDEALYAGYDSTVGNIRRQFYSYQYKQVETCFSTSFTFTGYSGREHFNLASNKRPYQLADFKNDNEIAQPKIRQEFKDLAFWQPNIITDANGRHTVKFNMPDNQTAWRATAHAVTPDLKVGSVVKRVVSRRDLMIDLEIPQFVTEGDTVTISGLVYNYLDSGRTAEAELAVTGALLLGQVQQKVYVARNAVQRVAWRISAAQSGEVKLRAIVRVGKEADGVELPLHVYPTGVPQTKAESVVISEEIGERTLTLNLPANVNAQMQTLRVDFSPSILGTTYSALEYLKSSPHLSAEQIVSSFLPEIAVKQALDNLSFTSGEKVIAAIVSPIDELLYSQEDDDLEWWKEDGGWGWWKEDRPDPFMTAYVLDGMAVAYKAGYEKAGFTVDELGEKREKIEKALDLGKMGDQPMDLESRAYLIYAYVKYGIAEALHAEEKNPQSGERTQSPAAARTRLRYVKELFGKRGELKPYGKALLALSLKLIGNDKEAAQVAAELGGLAQVGKFEAHWESTRRSMTDLPEKNNLEATAFALRALVQINPRSSLLAKAARWLVANRHQGRYWETTRHTAFAILALAEYAQVSKEPAPNYLIEVYLNGEKIFEKYMEAAEAISEQSFYIPIDSSLIKGKNQLRIVKNGSGILYASAALDYLASDETVALRNSPHLTLTRDYLRLKVAEVNGKPQWTIEPLVGDVRSGDLLVSRLRAQGARGQYLMIEDPLPAGCEQVVNVGGLELNQSTQNWSARYSAREINDRRTVLFQQSFNGDETFQYALRVRVPGEFRVAPARAVMMYQPVIQAYTEAKRLSVLEAGR